MQITHKVSLFLVELYKHQNHSHWSTCEGSVCKEKVKL